jgi:voltage-gated potassium channel Kch
MLSSPLTGNPTPWIAFSFNPDAVRDARKLGLPVLFGDGSNINVMRAATSAPLDCHDFFTLAIRQLTDSAHLPCGSLLNIFRCLLL